MKNLYVVPILLLCSACANLGVHTEKTTQNLDGTMTIDTCEARFTSIYKDYEAIGGDICNGSLKARKSQSNTVLEELILEGLKGRLGQ